jgi:hypothetical protein
MKREQMWEKELVDQVSEKSFFTERGQRDDLRIREIESKVSWIWVF